MAWSKEELVKAFGELERREQMDFVLEVMPGFCQELSPQECQEMMQQMMPQMMGMMGPEMMSKMMGMMGGSPGEPEPEDRK